MFQLNLRKLTWQQKPNESLKPFSFLYAWFVLMGGYRVNISRLHNTIDIATLTPEGIIFLAKNGYLFHISDEDISDKSKADYLAKGLVSFQVLWFVADVVQRKIANLPICLLEFHTLVNIGCWLITYSLWFSKPLNIKAPVVIAASGDMEQLLAVLLFKAEMARRPKFHSQYQSRWKPRHLEMEMWAWTDDNKMVVNFDSLEVVLKPTTEISITPAGNQPIIRTLRHGDVMDGLQERSMMSQPSVNARSEVLSQQARNIPRDLLKLSLSEKDDRRLGLVREYTKARIAQPPRPESVGASSPVTDGDGNLIPAPGAGVQCHGTHPARSRSLHLQSGRSSLVAIYQPSVDLEIQNSSPLNELHCAAASTTRPKNCTQHKYYEDTFCIVLHLFRIPKYGIQYTTSYSDIEDLGIYSLKKHPKGGMGAYDALPLTLLIIPAMYSAIHLIPDLLNWPFPSRTERLLWRISCYLAISLPGPMLAIIVIGIVIGIIAGLLMLSKRVQDLVTKWREGTPWDVDAESFHVLLWPKFSVVVGGVFIVFWLAARVFLLVEAFISLRREKAEVFQTPEWNWLDSIPHV